MLTSFIPTFKAYCCKHTTLWAPRVGSRALSSVSWEVSCMAKWASCCAHGSLAKSRLKSFRNNDAWIRMNDTKDTTIPVLKHGDKMDAHAVDGQGSSTQMAGAAQLHQSSQLCQSCTSSAVWKLWAHNKLSGLQFEHQTRNGVDACWCYLPGSCAAPGHMFARSHWAPLLGEMLALHVQHFWFIGQNIYVFILRSLGLKPLG